MDFDPQRDMFTMSGYESDLFDVPDGATEWPLERVDELKALVDRAGHRLADGSPTTVAPVDRPRAIAEYAVASRYTLMAQRTIAKHAMLTNDDMRRFRLLLDGEL